MNNAIKYIQDMIQTMKDNIGTCSRFDEGVLYGLEWAMYAIRNGEGEETE